MNGYGINFFYNLYYNIGALICCVGIFMYLANFGNIRNKMSMISLLFCNLFLSVIWAIKLFFVFSNSLKGNK